jgi:hypothetical protein
VLRRFVKEVLQRLSEYAYVYSSGRQSTPATLTASDWQKLAASAPAQNASEVEARNLSEHKLLCRSVCRCLLLLQTILDDVHGNCKPALLPHHASAKGSPIDLSIVLQNGLGAQVDGSKLAPGLTIGPPVADKAPRLMTLSAHSLTVRVLLSSPVLP